MDGALGILLRKTILLEGEPVSTVEITELELDIPLDPSLWVPPPTPELYQLDQPRAPMGTLAVEEAAEQLPFTVFVLPVIWPRAAWT